MTPQEVREHLSKLPEPHRINCLEAYASFPRENASGVRPNKYKVAVAIDSINWHRYSDWDYLGYLYNRANDGEFDTPQPDDDTMISVSSRHYNELKAKADKYDRMAEIARENAQNKTDEQG